LQRYKETINRPKENGNIYRLLVLTNGKDYVVIVVKIACLPQFLYKITIFAAI
jgi:hypothetical protein